MSVTVLWFSRHSLADAQTGRTRRVGALVAFTEHDAEGQIRIAAFRQQLQDLSWSEGRNLQIEFRYVVSGDVERMSSCGGGAGSTYARRDLCTKQSRRCRATGAKGWLGVPWGAVGILICHRKSWFDKIGFTVAVAVGG